MLQPEKIGGYDGTKSESALQGGHHRDAVHAAVRMMRAALVCSCGDAHTVVGAWAHSVLMCPVIESSYVFCFIILVCTVVFHVGKTLIRY